MFDLIISVILKGSMYILISSGLTLVYGVMGIPNFAHGEFYMIGAYAMYFAMSLFRFPPLLSLLFSAAAGFLVGGAVEKSTFYVLRRRSRSDWSMNTFLITAGLSFILQNLAQLLFTANYLGVDKLWGGTVPIGGFNVPMDRLAAFVIALISMSFFWIFLKRSRIGSSIRAVSENETGALLMGIPIDHVHTLTFGLSSMMAAIAGAALLSISPANPVIGQRPLYTAYYIVILVGLGNLQATILGSFIIAAIEVFATYCFGALWADAVMLSIIVLILVFKPSGLFGKKEKV